MRLFLSTFTNRIDKKGRVSIPAPFRNAISENGSESTVVAFPSIGDDDCVYCCDYPYFEKIAGGLDDFGPYTDERAAFATSLLADSHVLTFDADGRLILPPALTGFAALDGEVCFVGQGKMFQIWNPAKYEAFRLGARRMARERRDDFRLPGQAGKAGGGAP
jgi:MraZ protein